MARCERAWVGIDGRRIAVSFEDNNADDKNINYTAQLDHHVEWFATKLPDKPARFLRWLRKPSSRLLRIPLSLLLMIGGVFSFLPVLGLWMLPLGFILIAQDIPILEKPVAKSIDWLKRKWGARQSAKAKTPKSGQNLLQEPVRGRDK